MGNYYEGTLYLRFNEENGNKLLEDLKVLQKKKYDDKDLSDFSELMRDAKWLTHPRAFYPHFETFVYYDNPEGQLVAFPLTALDNKEEDNKYLTAIEEAKTSPWVGYVLEVSFCMKLYREEFDLGEAIVDFFRPYLDKSMYETNGHIGSIHDEDCTYDKDFFIEVPKPSKNLKPVSEEVKRKAIQQLKAIHEELGFIITELQVQDKTFCRSSDIASMVAGIEGMEWGCGTNRSGEKMFTIYFRNY